MSSFLSALAERALGRGHTLRLRAPSRFEPDAAAGDNDPVAVDAQATPGLTEEIGGARATGSVTPGGSLHAVTAKAAEPSVAPPAVRVSSVAPSIQRAVTPGIQHAVAPGVQHAVASAASTPTARVPGAPPASRSPGAVAGGALQAIEADDGTPSEPVVAAEAAIEPQPARLAAESTRARAQPAPRAPAPGARFADALRTAAANARHALDLEPDAAAAEGRRAPSQAEHAASHGARAAEPEPVNGERASTPRRSRVVVVGRQSLTPLLEPTPRPETPLAGLDGAGAAQEPRPFGARAGASSAAPPSALAPAPAASSAAAAAGSGSALDAPPRERAPRVNIQIGRIDVKPSPSAPPLPKAARSAGVSLESYLQRFKGAKGPPR